MLRIARVQVVMAAQIVHLAVNFLRCQDPSTHNCCSPFLSTCCWAVLDYFFFNSIRGGLMQTGGKMKLWPVTCDGWLIKMLFFAHGTQHFGSELRVVLCRSDVDFRIEFLPDFIRWYASTDCFVFLSACNTRLGFFGSFGSLACRWCKREKRRGDRGWEYWFIALMALSKMPSEAKDGMSQRGEMVLGAIWAGLGHMASTTAAQKEKMEWQYAYNSLMIFGATAWWNFGIAQIWFDWNHFF